MKNYRYNAVIFDLDGVITDTARFHYLAWKELAESLGVPFDLEFNEELRGVDRMNSLERILARTDKCFSPDDKLALAAKKNRNYLELVAQLDARDLLPGALTTLQQVHAAGLKIGLASSSQNAPRLLAQLGITHWFDCIADVRQINKGKPAPDIFLKAAEGLQAAPAECIGVEDSIAGVQSIKSAGMYAIGIGDPGVLRQADRVISGLDAFELRHFPTAPQFSNCHSQTQPYLSRSDSTFHA